MVKLIFKIQEYFIDESSFVGYEAFMLITIVIDPASCIIRCKYSLRSSENFRIRTSFITLCLYGSFWKFNS
jgi:hypothetical protein